MNICCDYAYIMQNLKEYEQRPEVQECLNRMTLLEREAFERGYAEGFAQGFAEGAKEALYSIVKNLKAADVSSPVIGDMLDLSIEEIDKILL